MPSDPYTDDEYDDTYKKVHGDEGAREQHTSDGTDDTFFPSSGGGGVSSSGWWGFWGSGDTVDTRRGDPAADERDTRDANRIGGNENDSWLDEGVIGLVLVAGIALFLFPEPVTSAAGIGLIAIGVLAWVVDWLG
jgi:hypothetical protein